MEKLLRPNCLWLGWWHHLICICIYLFWRQPYFVFLLNQLCKSVLWNPSNVFDASVMIWICSLHDAKIKTVMYKVPLAAYKCLLLHCKCILFLLQLFIWIVCAFMRMTGENKHKYVCFLIVETDRAVPCHIKFLRSQKVVYISCGEEHTAALTKVQGHLLGFSAVLWRMKQTCLLNLGLCWILICTEISGSLNWKPARPQHCVI